MALVFEVSGLGGPICTISIEVGASLPQVKAAIGEASSLKPHTFWLVHEQGKLYTMRNFVDVSPGSRIALTLVRRSPEHLDWLQQLKYGPWDWLKRAPKAAKRDWETVLASVAKQGLTLVHAKRELKDDRDFILEAVAVNGQALGFVNPEFQDDRRVVLAAVTQDGLTLRHATAQLRADREVVLAAVTQHGLALRFATRQLKSDREVVLAAVAQHGLALAHAAPALTCDVGVVQVAVAREGLALRHADIGPRSNRELVLKAVVRTASALQYVAQELQQDPEVLRAAGLPTQTQEMHTVGGAGAAAAEAVPTSSPAGHRARLLNKTRHPKRRRVL